MCGKEVIVEVLNSSYGGIGLLRFSEAEDELRFQLPAPIRDTQTAGFRSRATNVLNELAISHRLSLLVGRCKYGVHEDFAFAIKSIETATHSIETLEKCDVSLRFEVLARRRESITALRSTLVTKYGGEARITTTTFNILPPSLTNFVRRTRHFLDFAGVAMSRDKSLLSTVGGNQFRYCPSENDRLSDGRRVDHVPALTLIDIAFQVNGMVHPGSDRSSVSAEFLSYTDPRLEFDLVQNKDHSATEFVQKGQLVAIVRTTNLPVAIERCEDEARVLAAIEQVTDDPRALC